jgi:hypothetical protein
LEWETKEEEEEEEETTHKKKYINIIWSNKSHHNDIVGIYSSDQI